jgi:hypothetical protein
MLRADKTYWICKNRDCGMTAVCDATDSGVETHTCRCGCLMKKKAHATVFSYLNFLGEEESNKTADINEKEEAPCEN